MENHTRNSPKEWISIAYHSQPEEKNDNQKTKTKPSNHNNTTNQEMGIIQISQSTDTKNH